MSPTAARWILLATIARTIYDVVKAKRRRAPKPARRQRRRRKRRRRKK